LHKANTKDADAIGRQQDLERFTAHRRENDLPFDRKFLPPWWESPQHLEKLYWQNEDAAAALPPPAPRRKPNGSGTYVTETSLARTLEAIGAAVGEELGKRDRRIDELQRTALKDAGVYRDGRHYRCGDVCTDRGLMWVCRSDNSSRPGEGANWRLMHKSIIRSKLVNEWKNDRSPRLPEQGR
jgi:hypothetical protein